MVDQPVDAVLQAVLSLSIQTVAGLPQGVDASLAIINVLEIEANSGLGIDKFKKGVFFM